MKSSLSRVVIIMIGLIGCDHDRVGLSNCGDGVVDPGEQCDDGNELELDGCNIECGVEEGWDCTGTPSDCSQQLQCDVVEQSGCPPTTPACDVDRVTRETICRPVTADGMGDSTCTSGFACAAGFTCVDVGAEKGWCAKFCDRDDDCAGVGTRCINPLLDSGDVPIPNVSLCTNSCDPIAQTGCPLGNSCLPLRAESGDDYLDCVIAGDGSLGSSCSFPTDCERGLWCIKFSFSQVCSRICEVGGVNTCPPNQTCFGFAERMIVGNHEFGTCASG